MKQIRKVSKEIQNNKIAPVYLLTGTNEYIRQEFLKFAHARIIEEEVSEMNYNQFDANETPIEVALQDAETFPFMGERKMIVVTNCKFLTSETTKIDHNLDDLVAYLENPASFTSLFLVVPDEKMDSRKKVVKLLKNAAVTIAFDELKEAELYEWMKKKADRIGLAIQQEEMMHLVSVVGNDLYTLDKELQKLSLYVGKGPITSEIIDLLSTPALERDVFKLIAYVVNGDVSQAYRVLNDCLIMGEEPIKLMALLARQFRLLLLIKVAERTNKSLQEVATIAKFHPYAVQKAAEQAIHFSYESLTRLYGILTEEDYRMKTGRVDKRLAIQVFISKVAQEIDTGS